ncbi:alpha/beta-hydrolase [Penicillium chermesinum]|uniref:Alpha/beta-hydrolase n=1 Tax=Penicillium chermesinum TaxID=63820 RepID=A0A9W9NYU0_9EURO|nr:alpha/beta-hydrolase [Penicillium chermesinum]KAJ5232291.1 alpha/beta-hydrolase [Penicillium chermesinum]KAJ6171943.1 alpha/beta-hydrolase [Penicillium chermesinum]
MGVTWQTKRLLHGIRAIVGGQGPPVVLLAGWPQTAEAFSDMFEPLSKQYRFYALDPPGLGESSPSELGYDTKAVSKIMADSIHDALQDEKQSYHLVGHDVGAWISYPWAVQYPKRIKSLCIMDGGIPGFMAPLQYPLSHEANIRLWQFSFNALPDLPELLTRGRERELLNWFFNRKTASPDGLSPEKMATYVEAYSKPGVMSQGFEYYRSYAKSAEQNKELNKAALQVPVLGLGGASSIGLGMAAMAQRFAANVEGYAIADCGHLLPEEQPEAVARRLLEFWEKQACAKDCYQLWV